MSTRIMLRATTLIVVAVCFGLVFLIIYQENTLKFSAFSQPSYYATRNLVLAFVVAVLAVMLAVLASFFSWFRALDTEPGETDNPGGMTESEIVTAVGTSTLGTATAHVSERQGYDA